MELFCAAADAADKILACDTVAGDACDTVADNADAGNIVDKGAGVAAVDEGSFSSTPS